MLDRAGVDSNQLGSDGFHPNYSGDSEHKEEKEEEHEQPMDVHDSGHAVCHDD